jgi:endonuclease-8
MPEGDTLHRTADGLRPYLVGRPIIAARTAGPGAVPRIGRVVGATVTGVEAVGKNLLVRFDNGLELRTHLRMNGSWHRYRPGERWRRPPSRARLVLEVPGAVAVCFDAPVVELLEIRAEGLHPPLAALGPDLLDPAWGPDLAAEALRRLRDPARAERTIGEALVDQRALAGIGNVYKSEVLHLERADPWARVGELPDAMLVALVATAHRLLVANADRRAGPERVTTDRARASAGAPLWVYDRAGRPCRHCGTPIERRRQGTDLPRLTFWCPRCQGGG